MTNMVPVIFALILCFTSNTGGERHDNEVDSQQELLENSRLFQMNVEIEKLKRQIELLTTGDNYKRLVMEMDFEQEITNLKTRLDQKDSEIESLKQHLGSMYTRWGRTVCPGNGTELVYSGRMDCYPGWTKEYSGYLVGAYSGYDDGSEYVCLDRRPETVVHSAGSNNDNMLYFVEARCGASLECPPYISNRELACVVCSL